jgi:molybdate transport system substrate-binding protein
MTATWEATLAKLKVMCARSMHLAVGALGKAFAEANGHEVAFDFGTVGALQAKLDAGETADVVILSVPAIDKLENAGALIPGSRKAVAKTYIALCTREGAPRPDFATPEAFRRLLENARAIATSDPAVGGSAGVHLAKTFEQTGLAAMMAGKSLPQQSGVEVAKRVFGQDTIYVAAVMAGSAAQAAAAALIAALTRSDTREAWTQAGFDLPD